MSVGPLQWAPDKAANPHGTHRPMTTLLVAQHHGSFALVVPPGSLAKDLHFPTAILPSRKRKGILMTSKLPRHDHEVFASTRHAAIQDRRHPSHRL